MTTPANFFFIRQKGHYLRINTSDIRYVTTSKNHIRIITHKSEYKTLYALNQLEEKLPMQEFCRVHQGIFACI